MEAADEPNCMRCRHFFVTWEKTHPRGCKAYGFKSRTLPSVVVQRESGIPCQMFEPRSAPPGRAVRQG